MNNLFSILQIMGGNFPTGGFSQSWGLETYVSKGQVSSENDFRKFIYSYIKNVLVPFEVPLLCESYRILENGTGDFSESWGKVRALDEVATAMRLTKESRQGAHRTGKAFLRIVAPMINCKNAEDYYKSYEKKGINFPVVLGAVGKIMEIELQSLVEGFVFNSVNGFLQAGIKLVPLGNAQAQQILFDFAKIMSEAAKEGVAFDTTEMNSFCPEFDIASMEHENLRTRIYMS